MYGLWYIVIGALVGIILNIVILTILVKKFNVDAYGLFFMIFGVGVTLLLSACIFICSIIATVSPICAKTEYLEFEETRTMVEQVYESGTNEDNYAINVAIINSNQWLSEAKASKKQFGCFSRYYYIDVENIKPILLKNHKIP